MTLRTRLLLGYGYLIALVIVVAGTAAVGFFNLSGGLERVLESNVESVRASTEMLESLERQDSATLTLLIQPEVTGESLEESNRAFQTSLETARSKASTSRERELLDTIERRYQTYRQQRAQLLEAQPDNPLLAYENQTFPAFRDVKTKVLELLDHSYQKMVDAEQRVRSRATEYGAWLGFLVAIALLSLIFLTRGLRRLVLDRLTDLQTVAADVARGETQRRVQVERRDELGLVGEQFNEALDRQMELRSRMQGRLNEHDQLVAGLLHHQEGPCALLALDGEPIASTLPDDVHQSVISAARAWIDQQGRDSVSQGEVDELEMELEGVEAPCSIELVQTPGGRLVGWMVSTESA